MHLEGLKKYPDLNNFGKLPLLAPKDQPVVEFFTPLLTHRRVFHSFRRIQSADLERSWKTGGRSKGGQRRGPTEAPGDERLPERGPMAPEARHGGWRASPEQLCQGIDKLGPHLGYARVGPLPWALAIGPDAATRPSELVWNLGVGPLRAGA